jgi:asparagine synthase (glutamine-hydrolysing)
MCGIFAYLGHYPVNIDLRYFFNLISNRGPDNSNFEVFDSFTIGFHRLCINDLTSLGNQPFNYNGILLICNGEIYNYKELARLYNICLKSNSDCEIIIHLYLILGIEKTIKILDGEFAFVLIDCNLGIVYAGRDQQGVRPLFIGQSYDKVIAFSSLLKSLNFCERVEQFPPGHYWSSANGLLIQYSFPIKEILIVDYQTIVNEVRKRLICAVEKRINNTERNIGFLLSGGLDSSIVCAIAANLSFERIHTFSIGLEGSSDLMYARKVAEFINSIHHEIYFTENEGVNLINDVIWNIESFDTTTIRASIPQFILAKYISQNTTVKVLLTGEGADELCYGYRYHSMAPSLKEAQDESERLQNDLHFFDLLRSDRTLGSQGLEVRVPFLDKSFVEYYNMIDPKFKSSNDKIEKLILRHAFENYLPFEIINRRKEAFSDGVGHNFRNSLIKYSEQKISDIKFIGSFYKTKEQYLYKEIFDMLFAKKDNVIPYYWMPKWQNNDIIDPSATVLNIYN